MNSEQLYRDGNLGGAIEALTTDVKTHPSDTQRRTFLFELLAFAGDLDRAARQLDVIGHQDAMAEPAVQAYRNVLTAEAARRGFYEKGNPPQFFSDPPDYTRFHLEAMTALRSNEPEKAATLLGQSEVARPTLKGQLNNKPFEGFRDCDDLLAPFLELFVMREYVWVPFEQVRELEIAPPERPRDLLWAPVRLVLQDGSQRRGYVPVLYYGSHEHPDDQIKLGRLTDWPATDAGPVLGRGQRMYLAGDDDHPVLEIRQLTTSAPTS